MFQHQLPRILLYLQFRVFVVIYEALQVLIVKEWIIIYITLSDGIASDY